MRCDVSARLIPSLIVGLFLVSTIIAAPSGGAGSGTAVAEEARGALYLTNSRTNDPFLGVLNLFNPHYELTDRSPHGDDGRAAYLGMGSGADTHVPAIFSHDAAAAFRLDGTVQVFLFIACDVATVAPPSHLPPVRIDLVKNGDRFAFGGGGGSPAVCVPGQVMEVVVDVPDVAVRFEPGDRFRLEVGTGGFVNPGDPLENLHALVDSALHPSRIEAVGLPGPAAHTAR